MGLRLEVSALGEVGSRRVFRYEFADDCAQISLGRRGGVDVLLPDPRVSLLHARIERRRGEYYLVDAGSTNGTRLNGVRIPAGVPEPLHGGDVLVLGGYQLLVSRSTGRKGEPRVESSQSMARSMVRDLLERLGPGQSHPSLQVIEGAETGVVLLLPELGRSYLLGRAAGDDLRLDDIDMWREHALLERSELGVTLSPAGAHPIAVNGELIAKARLLRDGDRLTLGATTMRYSDPAEVYLRKLEEQPAVGLSSAAPTPPARLRPELLLLAMGGTIALLALLGLLFLLLGS